MIPVNIITGVLGVGKTTAVRHLLSLRPPEERWAIVVNEFGALGIDGADDGHREDGEPLHLSLIHI